MCKKPTENLKFKIKHYKYLCLIILTINSCFCIAKANYDISDVLIEGDSTLMEMRIENSYFNNGAFLIETTGARYEYVKGELKVYQGLDVKTRRLLSTITFDNEPNFVKVEANDDHIVFWSKDLNIGIYGDSTFVISPKNTQTLALNGHFKPEYQSTYQGLIVLSVSGGVQLFSPSGKASTSEIVINAENGGWNTKYKIHETPIVIKMIPEKSRVRRGIVMFYPKNEVYLRPDGGHLPVPKVEENVSRYDVVWYSRYLAVYNKPAWNYLRANRPDIPMFRYVGANSSTNNKGAYFNYDYINKHHPEWFLLADARTPKPGDYRDEDKRIRWDPRDPLDREYTRYYLDFGNKDFQRWAVNEAINYLEGKTDKLAYPYNGLALDNVSIGISRWDSINKRCPHFKYAGTPDAWHKAFFSYLNLLKTELNKRGFFLIANHNLDYARSIDNRYWEPLYNTTNGLMTEQNLVVKVNIAWYTEKGWLTNIKRHEDITKRGLFDLWTIYLTKDPSVSHEAFLYSYCSWMLVKQPGLSYYAINGDRWCGEYDLPIGEPMSKRYERNGCWVRNFVNAKIVVNPSSKTRKLTIDDKHLWYDVESKKKVKEMTLPPYSGRILLASPYSLNK